MENSYWFVACIISGKDNGVFVSKYIKLKGEFFIIDEATKELRESLGDKLYDKEEYGINIINYVKSSEKEYNLNKE